MDNAVFQGEKGRLIVLVPENLVNNMELVNKIYQMAMLERRNVYYLALVEGDTNLLAAARSIATVKALISGGLIHPHSQVVETSHWIDALCEIYRPGDVIVCHAEQQVRSGFLRTVPASEFIRARLNAPVHTISGFYHPEQMQIWQWVHRLAYWAGLLAILASFFLVEVQLDQSIHGVTRTALLIILLVVELGASIAWNRINS
jgi:hypothetical protein